MRNLFPAINRRRLKTPACKYLIRMVVMVPMCMVVVLTAAPMAMAMTMAVVMVAGNQPQVPGSVFDGVRTLTANIVLEMGYAADLHRGALIATGVVLFVLVMLVCALFHTLKTERSAQ